MLMVPEIRRIMLSLDSIPPDQRESFEIFHNGKKDPSPIEVGLVSVDPTTVFARAYVPGWDKLDSPLPLDRVTSVWRVDAKRWAMSIDGKLEIIGNALSFTP